MFEIAALHGIEPAAFWVMTPRELDGWVRARTRVAKEAFAQGLTFAWHSAAWGRSKTIPDLKPIIDRVVGRPARRMTGRDLLGVVAGINKALGGKDLRGRREGA